MWGDKRTGGPRREHSKTRIAAEAKPEKTETNKAGKGGKGKP